MKYRFGSLSLAYLGYIATYGSIAHACTPGAYRCGAPSGQGAAFFQCDAGGIDIQKTCAPGTVCYTQGDSILSGPPPANSSLVAGAQCSFASPFDEYMCPGPNGQHGYYLRCLSGTYVHFPCAPGTTCHKDEGQNMYCGLGGENNAASPASNIEVGSSSAVLPAPGGTISEPSIPTTTTTTEIEIGGTSFSWPGSTISEDTSNSSSNIGSSSSHGGLFDDFPPLSTETTGSVVMSMDITVGLTSIGNPVFAPSTSISQVEIAVSPGSLPPVDTTKPESSLTLSAGSSTSITVVNSPKPTASSGLSGPVISSGLEMLLNNGVQLPFTLPNIDLPAIDLATVHLPDMTFDGIAITAIPLPPITIPPLNPASLTHFSYIEDVMSRAGITFDDLAKLPLPDLSHLNMADLGHIDVGAIMSLANVNRISMPTNLSADDIAESLPVATQAPQTTTLGTNAIDALLGLSVMTYNTS
ncbi:hypothetical protein BX070DRAFT_231129 [Coemansia spiralis]|nr:hypothetical protein BX070DRAFT_231129 [Coemansia spiralis]